MPDRIGKYEIRGTLGRGAMGTVLDGWDPAIERRVAIKTVRLADAAADEEAAEALERFRREAQAAGRLSHANIVGVFDTGETEDLAYIVMEFIEGRSLKQVLDSSGALAPTEAAEIMIQVLAGLEYSHRRGVVHRDIKPANIMLTIDGGVKIADFGIARLSSSTATAVGSILGTPAYMPPEQFLGEPADARSDIFAAGAMLFHLLTGTRPYEGNATSIMTRVLNADAPPLPSERSVSVSPAWDKVTLKAMAKRPDDRFQTALDFSGAVRRAVATPLPELEPEEDATMVVSAPRAALPRAAEKPAVAALVPARKGGPNMALLGGGAVVAIAAAAGAWLLLSPGAKPPAPRVVEKPVLPTPPVESRPVESRPAPPVEAPPPSPEAVAAGLAPALAGLPCSFIQAKVSDGRVVLEGIAGPDAPKERIDALVASAKLPIVRDVQFFTGPYCGTLDVLAPVLRSNRLKFSATDKPGPISADEYFHPVVRSLPFAGWVQVDYFTGDGSVFHVMPMGADKKNKLVAEPARVLPAGAELRLGEAGHTQFAPGEPFGKDLFVAIASTSRLFPGLRRQSETGGSYAESLRTAIERVKASGGQIAAGVVLVKTIEKQP